MNKKYDESKYEINFQENLSNLLKTSKVSQKALAEHLGLEGSAIGRYLKGINFPNIAILVEMCKFFKVSLDEMLGVDDIHSPEDVKFISSYKECDDETKLVVNRVIEAYHKTKK